MRRTLHLSANGKRQHSNYRMPLGAVGFSNYILVECPRCAKCASITRSREGIVLTCPACGYARTREFQYIRGWQPFYEGLDPDFELPLWLRQPVAGHILWAYNWRHLEDLEYFLVGEWKMRRGLAGDSEKIYSHRPRYPKWMFLVKHRSEMLKALGRIRKRRL